MIVAALLAVVALPPARTAVGEWLRLVPGERIERGWPGSAPPPAQRPAEFAEPVPLAEAASRLRFRPALPAGRGEPEGVFVVDYGGRPLLLLQYTAFDL